MKHSQLKFIAATVTGNVMEWYDFALYGYFATILSRLFFPAKEQYISLLLTFAAFTTGFAARLIGGWIFGYIGDRYGRRKSLLISIACIVLPTAFIGLIPTYNSIGLWAPILLVICRLFQGFAVSGELTAAGIYLLECTSNRRQGFYGSLVMSSIYVGLLLGALVCWLVTILYESEIESFAWRIPFLISFFLGFIAIFLRFQLQDSPIFEALKNNRSISKKPVSLVFKSFLPTILNVGMMSSILAVAIYLLIGYFPSFYVIHLHLGLNESMLLSALGLLSLCIFVPLMGVISDRIGCYKTFSMGCIAFLIGSYGFFMLIDSQSMSRVSIGIILFAISLSPISGSIMSIMIRAFPVNVRCSGVSLGYNSSMALIGGVTPLMALISHHYSGVNTALAFYLIVAAIVALWAIARLSSVSLISENLREGYVS